MRFKRKADIKGAKERMFKAASGVSMLTAFSGGRRISENPDVSCPLSDRRPAAAWGLLKAVRLQDVPQVRRLLEQGASPSGEEASDGLLPKLTPLVAACKMGHVIITQLLLNHNAPTAHTTE